MRSRRPALAVVCLWLSLPAFAAAPAAPPAKPAETCTPVKVADAPRVDARVRQSAHRGLTYLSAASQKWTQEHRCFGCHVQAVTMEALSVGKKHQYDVDPKDIDAMAKALKLGVTAGGRVTGVAFEGSAWARFDALVKDTERAELLRYAEELTKLQRHDGAIPDDDARLPVTGGTMQTTFQAAQTWRQAYARTADEKWLPPLRRAEQFLTGQSKAWDVTGKGVYLQDLNFALLGLVASGVGRTEEASLRLQRMILERQNKDGGWGLEPSKSDAFATGQTVYTLKMAGFGDGDPHVAKGIGFLIGKQGSKGEWNTYKSGQGGAEKAETMWAVLGLVTVDVASITVHGLVDGQHVEPNMTIDVATADNQGGGIKQVQVLVDDLEAKAACGGTVRFAWDTTKLTTGKHIVEVVAVNAKGQQSRRAFEVYAGDVFLTGVGAQFDDRTQATTVSLRNIAPAADKDGAVKLEVFSVEDGAEAKPKDKVFTETKTGELGGLAFNWKGTDAKGKALPRGRYVAKLTFTDAKGKPRQSEQTLFFHDSELVQQQKFGQVEGQIQLERGARNSANTLVELVDDDGNVVQATRTTEQGNYRFKTVQAGKYKVRVKKQGFADMEAPVAAEANAPAAKASMSW